VAVYFQADLVAVTKIMELTALGVETVAVHTADDAASLHIRHADMVRVV
jgi:biotin carboxylase